MKRLALLVALTVLLGGCAATTRNLLIVGRENGAQGSATVSVLGRTSGDIEIALGGKSYKGTWVYVASGGAVGFGTGTAFSGTASATATSTMMAIPTGGGGTILASAEDGSSLRCQFSYNSMSRSGAGVCQDNHNATYDLQIT